MKAVMLSIQPKWCSLIANDKKTVEIRKTKPATETPFKCYIYCTKSNKTRFWIGKRYSYADERSHNAFDKCGNGKIIGTFICDEITTFPDESSPGWLVANSRLTSCELGRYAGDSDSLYAWHISDLVIYDEPKELSEFWTKDTTAIKNCEYSEPSPSISRYCRKNAYWCRKCHQKQITRPPRSWCYVEEREQE